MRSPEAYGHSSLGMVSLGCPSISPSISQSISPSISPSLSPSISHNSLGDDGVQSLIDQGIMIQWNQKGVPWCAYQKAEIRRTQKVDKVTRLGKDQCFF